MFKSIWKSVFSVYIILIIIFIVLKFDGNVNNILNTVQNNIDRRAHGGMSANLIPFRTIEIYISDLSYGISIVNILGNIIPFIPMGFLIPMAFPSRRNFIITMVFCLLLISSIEILQFIFFLGSFDIDDFILNLFSCSIGFIIFISYRNVVGRRKGEFTF